MNKKLFVICDSNEDYVRKLYEYIVIKESESYELLLFTSKTDLDEFLKKREIEILVIDESMCDKNEEFKNIKSVIILKEEDNSFSKDIPSVYKYKSGDLILKEIMNFCSLTRNNHIRRSNKRGLKVIGVYSPVKRCFQSTFSITLGQILAAKGKAIYLNFECFSGFDILNCSNTRQDMSDLMYFIGCGSDSFSYRLGSMINTIGRLDYVAPAYSYISRMSIRGEEWLKLIESFELYTDYDYLILDLSENIFGLFDLLRECSIVFTVIKDDAISKAKISHYENLLEQCDYSDVKGKTKQIKIPKFRKIPAEYEMLPFCELAGFVKNIVKENLFTQNE